MRTRKAARDAGVSFVPRDAVRWFSPMVLARSGLRVVLAGVLGSYLDKRELQQSFPSVCVTRHGQEEELWFDFVADTGDGFDATYSVAWLAGRERLPIVGSDQELPRGRLLILGGDQVYPCAGPSAYEDRFTGPFRAAFPLVDDENEAPSLVAIPGNHDWYDGLTAFVRAFAQERWIGAWRSVQRRSYTAVKLPHDWWLWAIDLQKGADLDEPQKEYFEEIARELMGPDAKVILCVAEPAWVDAAGDPGAYAALDYLVRKLIEPFGARVLLMLTGDSHHYAHYVGDDGSHKVTAGGGGAFLHPTHDLPETITLESPTPGGTAPPVMSSVTYRLEGRCYPSRAISRRLAWGALGLPIRNPSCLILPGLLH
ncbi:MAG: metallophosphoesterase, partial [Actinobacteria bacterium]|nr:metallophosphoesterase [Actinomycetota bacterium]